jgi:hypothetical protein
VESSSLPPDDEPITYVEFFYRSHLSPSVYLTVCIRWTHGHGLYNLGYIQYHFIMPIISALATERYHFIHTHSHFFPALPYFLGLEDVSFCMFIAQVIEPVILLRRLCTLLGDLDNLTCVPGAM